MKRAPYNNFEKDNGNIVHTHVHNIIEAAIFHVADDYQTLFAVEVHTDTAEISKKESMSDKHKQGKIILSHLETLLKINETYLQQEQGENAEDYRKSLIDDARYNLQDGSKA